LQRVKPGNAIGEVKRMDPLRSMVPAAAALVLALHGGAALAAPPPAAASMPMMTTPLTEQSTEAGGVTVTVKPLDVAADAKRWSFRVSLRAARGALRDDLLRTAYLLNRAAGTQEAPLAWQADAAGAGRTGTLSFKPVSPLPAAVELRIQRVGEKAPRVFRWDLDCPCNDHASHAAGKS